MQEVLIIFIKINFVWSLIGNGEYVVLKSWASPPEVEMTVLCCSAASVCVIQPNYTHYWNRSSAAHVARCSGLTVVLEAINSLSMFNSFSSVSAS